MHVHLAQPPFGLGLIGGLYKQVFDSQTAACLDAETEFLQAAPGKLRLCCLAQRGAQFFLEIAQGAAQSLFDHWMIKRHLKHLRHSHFVRECPGKQMPEVLGAPREHLGTQEAPAGKIAIRL